MRRVPFFFGLALLSCAPSREQPRTDAHEIAARLRAAFPVKPAAQSTVRSTIPQHAASALHLAVSDDAWIELSPRGVRDVAASDVDGMTVFASALPDVDLAYVREADRIEDLRIAHTHAAAAKSV